MSTIELNNFIRNKAQTLGFSKIGFAPAVTELNLEKKLTHWLKQGYHSSMHWMETQATVRSNIPKYYPEIKSVVSLALDYFTGVPSDTSGIGKISNYAWGDDYHTLIKPRLHNLLNDIKTVSNANGIASVDTAPIMEKAWAQKAGLGWIGKHTNLITRDYGSWLFLGEILLDIELIYDTPFNDDLCGSCTACLDACPTNAFPEPYILDASKCISYYTIEHREEIPSDIEKNLSGWIFGCDICQQVCPWNEKFAQFSTEEKLSPRSNLQNRHLSQWSTLTMDEFRLLFQNSAVKRTKFSGLTRNIQSANTLLED